MKSSSPKARPSLFASRTPANAAIVALPKLKGKCVAQILPRLNRGGVERGTIEIASAIIAAGGRAIVISEGGDLLPRLIATGATHISMAVASKNPLAWHLTARQLRQVLVREGVDLVHIRSRASAWIGVKAARACRLPIVTTIHGPRDKAQGLKHRYNAIMTRADRIIAISKYVAGLTATHYPASKKNITIIPRGVDIGVFDPAIVPVVRITQAARKLNLPGDDRPLVILPARPTAWKGQEVMLSALALLEDKQAALILVGADDGKAKFKRRLRGEIKRLGLEHRVWLTPLTDDMPAVLMLADVVVMPSTRPEGFGRVAIEAQAMARPVVAFAHGGAVESIKDGETGFLAPPIEASGLAVAVDKALAMTSNQRNTMGKKAQAHVRRHFTATQMVVATLAVYRGSMRGRE
ncbi:MAG: glycosyltransferase family 4 protein, partial [Proteobacteria bacterium]|nr:glycosyltransferase family 4 protein [Pseudomonadota bacterium]